MDNQLEQLSTNIKRVVLMGPESSGKSTLAKALSNVFETNYVKEYMRIYLENKWREDAKLCEEIDIQPIVEGQIKLENKAIETAQKVIFCDTNALQNLVYANEYYPNYNNDIVHYCSTKHTYDLYLLCNIDIPWEEDILRDKPFEREKMFAIFVDSLKKRNIKFTVISGNKIDRLELSISLIQDLIKSN